MPFSTAESGLWPRGRYRLHLLPADGTAMTVRDISGQVLCNASGNSIDFSRLASGMYFAEVRTGTASEVLKVLKR